ncbi:helix-turn-helix transcriptional regulator [Curvibacter sp. HBC28]|uniref:Helix-turn-helix transcriptional regulator n=1 Tax=Curvibacter microcysteis TaxID=3026419 RepID=A0ABT5MGG3_9BURK|nr:helix-turn-helix transcriptional regulator [Curvibacter sp. HBC28]MDD0814260.1 helix-turn-helix transcriptional regulator [Curvibacter sp. HBC28]
MDGDFPQRLIKARAGHGWSQADLAEVSGVAAAQISRYELGRSRPRSEVIARLAKAMAVSFDWLANARGDIDVDAEVPAYPGSQTLVHTFELSEDDELYRALAVIAKHHGVTIEMAAKIGLRQAAEHLASKLEQEGVSSQEQETARLLRVLTLEPPLPAAESPLHQLPLPTNATRKHERKGPSRPPNAGKPKG